MAQLLGAAAAEQPQAVVYLGPNDDPDLSKAVGELLESSPSNFKVDYVGPKDITPESLSDVAVIAFPGGPGK